MGMNKATFGQALWALFTVCGVVRVTAEQLCKVGGPVTPFPGQQVCSTKIAENMYFQFDVTLNNMPGAEVANFGWANVLEVGSWSQNPWYLSMWIAMDADQSDAVFPGWLLPDASKHWHGMGGPLVVGKTYHFQFDWTASHLIIKIDGETVENAPSSHNTIDSVGVWMSEGNGWPAADVSISNFVIQDTPIPRAPTAADIDDLRVAVMNKIDTFGNEDDGPESKPLIGSILRLVFHDCSGPFNDGTTSATNDNSKRLCDGCIDLDKGDHGGLQSLAVEPLEEICSEFAHIMNRADCWAAVGNVAMEYSHSLDELNDDPLPNLPYFFGREECPLSPNAITDNDEGTEFPLAHLGWDAMIIFFIQNLGFSLFDTVAILGAHTVGRAHQTASGFRGKWTEDSFAFNNEYYVNMLDAANQWDQDFGTSNGFPQWNNDGRTDGDDDLLMLNADLGLIAAIENHGFDANTGEVDCRLNGFTLFEAETCGNEVVFNLVNTYAQDNAKWLNDYVSAWNKLVTRNQPELTQVDATDFVDLRGDVSVFVEHPRHNGFPRDFLAEPEPNTWTLTLSGKDLAILILIAINLVTIVAVYCQCVRSKGRKPTKYQVVKFQDSEMDSEEVVLQ